MLGNIETRVSINEQMATLTGCSSGMQRGNVCGEGAIFWTNKESRLKQTLYVLHEWNH